MFELCIPVLKFTAEYRVSLKVSCYGVVGACSLRITFIRLRTH